MLDSIGDNIKFVLSHPNGWEGKQQSQMRRAAIDAGLVANMSEALTRIDFVTEGEASLHFCLNKIPTALEEHANDGVSIVDCGGGTVDISTYARSSDGHFREIAPAECLLQGSCFVTRRAQTHLTEMLQESRYGKPEDMELVTRYFDKTTKPRFKSSSMPYFVRIGRPSENDPQFNIRNGSVKLDGSKIAEFFKPAVQSVIRAIEEQSRTSSVPIKAIFMVGGFATSDYLFSRLGEHFNPKGIKILRPDSYLNKAVAEGTISYNLDHSVTSRVSRYTYGIRSTTTFDLHNPEHVARWHTCHIDASGRVLVSGRFSAILEKGTEIFEETEFRSSFCSYIHQERRKPPTWIDQAPDFFSDLCTVSADMSELKKSNQPQTNQINGEHYYELEFDIVILFGFTELKAQIAWLENKQILDLSLRGPASIIYDTSFEKDP
ncbi:hypothetical protein F5887DRAFT_993201 [Amanita rubescens]|nr:hypothetical protein F5887DRAFT_993201 [Amanita rubescens]